MRIGVDIKALRSNTAGIGVYLRSLLRELERLDRRNEYFLFTPAKVAYEPHARNFKLVVSESRLPGILWQQLALPRLAKELALDVFWGPEQTIFCLGGRRLHKVLTVHDFAYRRFPQTLQGSVLWILRTFGAASIRRADAVVCVSRWTRRELLHFYPQCGGKAFVVENGVTAPRLEARERGKFLLFSGSLEPRKNLGNLLSALEILADKGVEVPLKIAGPCGWKNSEFEARLRHSKIAKQVTLLGYVPHEELFRLYGTCAALVFPSLYEGFGLPALEALAAGARVLTSKNTPMQDFLGELGLYFDPTSPESIAGAIQGFLNSDKAYSKSELDTRRAILSRLTWENAARNLIKVFEA